MRYGGSTVILMQNRMYGYFFRFIQRPVEREAFMQALKNAIPMKMFDAASKRWWVPDIYSSIIESIALQHGALVQSDLANIAGARVKYENTDIPFTLDGDFAILGCQPGVPLRLVEMAAAYWKVHLSQTSVSILALQEKQEAWARIQAHFEQLSRQVTTTPQGGSPV